MDNPSVLLRKNFLIFPHFQTSHFWQILTCNFGQNNVTQQNINDRLKARYIPKLLNKVDQWIGYRRWLKVISESQKSYGRMRS